MAKVSVCSNPNNQATNRKTCDEFLMELKSFHSLNKTPFYREPYLLGRKMDLLKLYNIVLSRGGFKKVTEERTWPLIVEDLRLGRRCVNASLAVKQVYQRYLETYERFHTHDEDGWPGGNVTSSSGADNEVEGESESTSTARIRCGRYAPAPSECAVPMIYNENAHLIPPHMRQKWGLSTQLVELKEYSLLEKSLHSGLPNEVDFSLNTALLMSSQPSGLNLTTNRGLVDLLLAHVGVFDEGSGSYLPVEPYWRQQDDRNMLRYWYENIIEPEARIYLMPGVFSHSSSDDIEKKFLEKIEAARRQLPLPIIYNLFNLRDDLTLPDTEGHRVFVVATALRNLALDEKCTKVLASHPQVLRFALLCGHARHAALRQLGQEMLALLRFPIKGTLARYFIRILSQCVNDVDRTTRLRGLEMIARQCQLVDNKQFLSNELPSDVYDAIIANLLVKDLHLVVNALEATYMLSTIGTDACERLISNEHCIPLLMSLLTIEAQAMGTDGLIRVKIMQGLNQTTTLSQSPVLLGQQSLQSQSGTVGVRLMPGQSLMPPPNSLPRSGAAVVAANASSATTARQNASLTRTYGRAASPQIQQQQQSGTGQSAYIPIAPKPSLTAQPVINPPRNVQTNSPLPTQQSNVKQNQITTNTTVFHTAQSTLTSTPRKGSQAVRGCYMSAPDHPQNTHFVIRQYEHDPEAPTERREFTLYWLRKYYEPYSQASVSRVHIYTEFQRAYSKQFQQLTNVTALEFHSCVKEAFPNVGQVKVQVPAGNVEIHYNHIKHVDDSPPSLQLPLSVTSSGTNLTFPQILGKGGSSASKSSASIQQPQQKVAVANSVVEFQQSPIKHLSPKPPDKILQISPHSKPENMIQLTSTAVGNQPVLKAELPEAAQSVQQVSHRQILPSFKVQSQSGVANQQNSLELQESNIVMKKDNQVTLLVHKTGNQLMTTPISELPIDSKLRPASINEVAKLNHHQQLVYCSPPMECDVSNGNHIEASNDVEGKSASPLHSCKSQESRKRSQPSPPVIPISPISSPAPKRSRPNSVASCTANSSSGSISTDECTNSLISIKTRVLVAGIPEPLVKEEDSNNLFDHLNTDSMVNGDSKGPSALSETPVTSMDSFSDDKNNMSIVSINGDETMVRRVFNDTSLPNENSSNTDEKVVVNIAYSQSPRVNRLINGESASNYVNGLTKGAMSTIVGKNEISDTCNKDSGIANALSANLNSQDLVSNSTKCSPICESAEDNKVNSSQMSMKDVNISVSGILNSTDNVLVTGTAPSSLSVVKTVNVPSQAVLLASHCGHISTIDSNKTLIPVTQDLKVVSSSQSRHTNSLITTSNIVQQPQKQVCQHNQIHHHITNQRACNHQPNHVHIAPQTQQIHHCSHHTHIHQHHANSVQNHHRHNHSHQTQQHVQVANSVNTTAPVQNHVCCHHKHQQQPQAQTQQGIVKSLTGTDTEVVRNVNGIIRVPVISDSSTNVIGVTETTVSPSITAPAVPPHSTSPSVSQSSTLGTPTNVKSVRNVIKSRRTPTKKLPITCASVSAVSESLATNSVQSIDNSSSIGHMCEWEGCNQVFDTSTTLQKHVFSEHVPVSASDNHPPSRRYECQWSNCDRVPRGLYSLQGHVQDLHLSQTALQQAQTRRQSSDVNIPRNNQTNTVRVAAAPTTVATTIVTNTKDNSHKTTEPSYPIDAAMQAIRRHATVPDLLASDTVQSSVGNTNTSTYTVGMISASPANSASREGPVTKHLRLTAALTIRNLVTYSDKARVCLRHQESHLAELALSSMESSKTICQFLYLLENADET